MAPHLPSWHREAGSGTLLDECVGGVHVCAEGLLALWAQAGRGGLLKPQVSRTAAVTLGYP